jgi:RNA polymerase sigma-70 factor (ECF subfamily)
MALDEMWAAEEDRPRRMVELRLDRRLQGRVDVAEILREAFAEAMKRRSECPQGPKSYPILWFRKLVGERLAAIHHHRLDSPPTR